MEHANPAPIRKFVHQQATPYTIRRRTSGGTLDIDGTTDVSETTDVVDTESTYGTEPLYESQSTDRRILIVGTSESMQPTMAGERESQSVIGYTLPGTDLKEDDVFDSGGKTYEVLASHGVPDEENPIVVRHELDNP